jgi:hypothetical protein
VFHILTAQRRRRNPEEHMKRHRVRFVRELKQRRQAIESNVTAKPDH